MGTDEFRSHYLGEPEPFDHGLLNIACEYALKCEDHDRAVCSGPVTREFGIMPANVYEGAKSNRYAAAAWKDALYKASALAFDKDDLRDAMRLIDRVGAVRIAAETGERRVAG